MGPQVVDLDGDGKPDLISGGYDGDINFFKGMGGGRFAPKTILIDAKQFGKGKIEGYTILQAASVAAADWDGDGDIDLIVGCIFGEVYYFENTGTKTNPKFGKPVPMMAGGKAIGVGQKAGPEVADWDCDGKLDLIVGSESSGVLFFRNIGTKTAPKLADPITIVPADDKTIGCRMKPRVVDWNKDGLPDLLVGGAQMADPKNIHGYVWLYIRQ